MKTQKTVLLKPQLALETIEDHGKLDNIQTRAQRVC